MTGGTAAIPQADRAAFRDSGLAHLLAIAGLHIGIVMGLTFGATRLGLALWEHAALHWNLKTIAALAALAAGGLYLLLTGAHVPILRSFAMACLATLGVIVGRRAVSLRGLALAMAAIVLIAPSAVVGVSFQMSFSAVLALIAGYDALRPRLARLHGDGNWRRRMLGHVAALALTSALAGTASAPYGAYHFGHVQLYYILANVVAVPLDGAVGDAGGHARLAVDAAACRGAGLVPMGQRRRRAVGGPHRCRLARSGASGSRNASLGAGGAVARHGLAGAVAHPGALAGLLAIALGLGSPTLNRPPDILVSADARLIGLRTPAGLYVEKASGASRFTLDSWLQYLAERTSAPLPLAGSPAGTDIDRSLAGQPRPARRDDPARRGGLRRGAHHLRRTNPWLLPGGGARDRPLHRLAGRGPGGVAGLGRRAHPGRPTGSRRPPLGAPFAHPQSRSAGPDTRPDRGSPARMTDPKRHAPATARNRDAILAVLRRVLPQTGLLLEIASGTGEHAACFAPHFPGLTLQPTDLDSANRASIDAWARGIPNIRPAITLDSAADWPDFAAHAVLCCNMIHIAPWKAAIGLLRGAWRVLGEGGLLLLYGPFRRDGQHTAPSNAAFDADLRARNPEWGVRDLESVATLAAASGFATPEIVAMPANNLVVIFRRQT